MLGIFERSASSMAAATRALASALRVYRLYLLLHIPALYAPHNKLNR